MQDPTDSHIIVGKIMLRYLTGTLELGVLFIKMDNIKLISNSDSDFAGNVDDVKNTSGYVFTPSN